MALRLAGFENRDTISHEGPPAVRWYQGQGFPKSLNVSKAIDAAAGAEREVVGTWKPTGTARIKGGGNKGHGYDHGEIRESLPVTAPATDAAKQWDGWGTALKPAWEIILMFRKPIIGTVAANVLAHGTGALNIDACRIALEAGINMDARQRTNNISAPGGTYVGSTVRVAADIAMYKPGGRWPANLVLSHSAGCRLVGTRRVRGSNGIRGASTSIYGGGKGLTAYTGEDVGYADADGTELVEHWECDESCPVAQLDRQSGATTSTGGKNTFGGRNVYGGGWHDEAHTANAGGLGGTGGASRFFKTFASGCGFIYTPKPSRRERDAGCENIAHHTGGELTGRAEGSAGLNNPRAGAGRTSGGKNLHPTVKGQELMRYLCRMVTQPDGVVLDPFMGSGSTGAAALAEGFRFIGVEQNPEYVEIARARMAALGVYQPELGEAS
jgi:hypothetical protein